MRKASSPTIRYHHFLLVRIQRDAERTIELQKREVTSLLTKSTNAKKGVYYEAPRVWKKRRKKKKWKLGMVPDMKIGVRQGIHIKY